MGGRTSSGVCLIFYLSFRLGRFERLAQRKTVRHAFRVTREDAGEVIVDLAFISLTFTNRRKFASP
jgi:hypothetical protein